MMRRPALLAAVAALVALVPACPGGRDDESGQIATLLTPRYEHKLISSGRNFPAVRLEDENRGDLAVLLHAGVPLGRIRDHFGWSEADLQGRLDGLEAAGVVRQNEAGTYLPTFLVMSIPEVNRFMPVPGPLVEEAADLIFDHLPLIRRRYEDIDAFRNVPFASASLLILSDVLLDNWQINRVERRFLEAERPLRAGSRYYYSMQERAPGETAEAFGIYGNQYRQFGPATVGVYGNRRAGNARNFLLLDAEDLGNLFGPGPDSLLLFQQEVLAQFVEAARDPGQALPAASQAGWEQLGWVGEGAILVPVLDGEDRAALSELAGILTHDLLDLLEAHRPDLTRAYTTSPYADEATFGEYFIWWYHLFYTAVTDRLIARGAITVPESGIASYVLVSGE